MAIKIKFDLTGNPEPPTIILATRSGNKLGQLDVNSDSIELSDKFDDVSEFSFTLNKYINGELTNLWDKVVDFKLVYCKEWDMWFEITVELDEETKIVKTVTCTQLGQAELSQIMLYDIEINTEDDIARDDYKISILYDENDHEASILNRILKDKAPHYSIAYVSPTIAKIQRSFSFNDKSICDAFKEIAEEVGCIFIYNSNSDENGKIQRTISVYDLQQYCNNCGYRGEFTNVCPKCNSVNITNGYGEDTLIFVTSDELATEGIGLSTDVDSVKNCFKLEAGDDLMTATIRNCNPNGTDYIWYFSDSLKEDMSEELVGKLESYNELYKNHYSKHESDISSELLNKYNILVDKYLSFNKDLKKISVPIVGYSALMNAYYNTVDLALYLRSALMPSVEMSETSAKEQAELLTHSSLSSVAVANIDTASKATVDSTVLSMAKIIVKSTYKVQINTSEYNKDTKKWSGNFIITNYSDEEDVSTSNIISVDVNGDLETFIEQKIEKVLNKEDTDDLSISGLFKKGYDAFCSELKKYALNPLVSFKESCQACIDILIEQGVNGNNTWSDSEEGSDGNLYENLYVPYYDKLKAIEAEIKIREDELAVITGIYDLDGNLIASGLQADIERCRTQIQDILDFEKYLGTELWLEFCTYRREDKYSNDNYISDGLNNTELFKKALEFFEVAENEIYKSSELQHSISATLNNLLAIPKFESLVESFSVGNWIRVQIDDKIYKLRLLEYKIDFGDFDNIPVEFSDVTKIKNSISDIKSVLSQASSMATSYNSVQRQASQGDEARSTIDNWLSNGLNSAFIQIQNNNAEEITFTKNGLLGRSYSDITGTYAPEQFKLTHNIFAYTDDDWKTVSSALGKHRYSYWNGTRFVDEESYGLSTKFVNAGHVIGSQIIGGQIVSSNYKSGESGTYFNLIDGDFEIAGGNIVYDTRDKALTLRNVTIEWANTNAPEVTVNDITGLEEYLDQLDDLEDQLDGRAQTWYQDSDPSIEWTTDELKSVHVGDLWHYTGETKNVNGTERVKNSEWVWQKTNGGYQWVSIEISDDVFDVIDGKAQIFTSTPTPPYYKGDLWVQGTSGDILHCIIEKAKGQSYSRNDWEKSSKYTDDTSLNAFIDGDYASNLGLINSQLDKKAETWYQDSDPSIEWTTDELKSVHVGDLWHYTGETTGIRGKNSEWIWQKVGSSYQWVSMEVPDEVFDAIDGKSSIYVTMPDNPEVGDLLIPTSDIGIYKAGKVYRYNGSSWIEINYTDDTTAREALEKAKQGIADAATGINLADIAKKTADLAQGSANDAYNRAENAETNAKDYADEKDKTVSSNANAYADSKDQALQNALTTAYQNYANSKVSELDESVASYLGLGGSTIIGQNYVISPYIGGGYLNITNVLNGSRVIIDPNNLTGNNYIFQVHDGSKVTVGIDGSGNAIFSGTVNATGGNIGGFSLINNSLSIEADDVYVHPTYANINKFMRYSAKLEYDLTDKELEASDVNGDGKLDVRDSVIMLRAIAGNVKYSDYAGAKTGNAKIVIDPNNPEELINITGTNAWGTESKTHLGVNGLRTSTVNTEFLTLNGNFVKAPVVLYSNRSGTDGTVTLSESAEDFDWLYIVVGTRNEDGVSLNTCGSLIACSPNNNTVDVSASLAISNGVDIRSVRYLISGKTMTPSNNYASKNLNNTWTYDTNKLYCSYVIGFKGGLGNL